MNDTTKEYHGKNTYTNNVVCNAVRLGGSWNLVTNQGGIPQGEVAPSAAHSNLKCKILNIFTCHGPILTFHLFSLFRFKLNETVTLTFNLTQLFYFQNISFLFPANKSKHTASNLKSLKQHKLGGGNLIFIFRRDFPYEGNQGNVDTPLHTMNTKHQVLNKNMNL